MSEFDEDLGSQDFDDFATDSVDFTESEELQSVDVSSESDFGADEYQEEAEPSISELRDQAEREAAEAQQEAEEWADSNNLDTWSDGTPRQDGDVSGESDFDADEYQEEAEPSISELRDQAEREAAEAQQEAEEWADNGDANRWSDGSIREGHEDDMYDRSTNQL